MTYPGLTAFHANRTHDSLFAVEDIWVRVIADEALEGLPSGSWHVVSTARSHDRVFILASDRDDSGAIRSYAHWMLCPISYGADDVRKITQPSVFLNDGSYGHKTLTDAVASISARTGITL